jgi:hypothetical protein
MPGEITMTLEVDAEQIDRCRRLEDAWWGVSRDPVVAHFIKKEILAPAYFRIFQIPKRKIVKI